MYSRDTIVRMAQSWVGIKEGSPEHHTIIDIYNNHKPLAQGYKVKYTDAWCMTMVSSVFIACNYTDLIKTECSCQRAINLFKEMGIWVENDAYEPKPADLIFYDWQDNGIGDNVGQADHVGIVEDCQNGVITVIEGNMSGNPDKVGRRTIKVNGTFIRGYACPHYDNFTGGNSSTIVEKQEGLSKNDFIKQIAICSQEAYKTLGKVRPSVCIGMACVESAYGSAKIMADHNAYMGHKVGTGKTATKYWDGAFFNANTKEEYQLGVQTAIKSNFRAYNSMQQCILNFYELLNTYLYDKVQDAKEVDYATQMKQIKQCGYMTSSTEVNTVIRIIGQYNLARYDNVCYDSEYYPEYRGSGNSIVNALESVGEADTSKTHRTQIALANGITDYTGTAYQNTQLLALLKNGQLKKA